MRYSHRTTLTAALCAASLAGLCLGGPALASGPDGGSRPVDRTAPAPLAAALGTATVVGLSLGTASIAAGHEAGDARRSLAAQPSQLRALNDVDGTSHSDLWAVGLVGAHGRQVAHFDRTGWTTVPFSGPAGYLNAELRSVSARTATDAWAAGNTWGSAGGTRNLLMHWDGTRWARVPTPNLGFTNLLLSVSADSATDAWAVGSYYQDGHAVQPIALHWDGTDWTQVDVPPAGRFGSALSGVTAVSPTDAWAVGASSQSRTTDRSLVVHWDGTQWTRVDVPLSAGDRDQLVDVTATSATNAWAVGSYSQGDSDRTLIYKWNGVEWAQVASPTPGHYSALFSISASSPDQAWAVGLYLGSHNNTKLALHWDGDSWRKVPTPNEPGSQGSLPGGVTTRTTKDATAVGYSVSDKGSSDAVILHWNGAHWVHS